SAWANGASRQSRDSASLFIDFPCERNGAPMLAASGRPENACRSVAVRRAEREERAIGPCLVHRAGEGGPLQQAPAIGAQGGEGVADRLGPVGIEEERRRRAV